MEEEKNMIKGQEGEAFVIREVGKVANYLGKTIRCFNHVILDFDSVYGSRTAELDHIIICGDKILIGETKNANYVSTEYSEIPWNLMNGKTTDNPIVQNHYHKQIFCSLFNISRENVITVECLLEYEKCRYRTQFPNDYVLGHDNLFDALCLLFLEFVQNDKHYSRYYDAFLFLFSTGLRISEFCGLTVKDLDFEEEVINVDHKLQRSRNYEVLH